MPRGKPKCRVGPIAAIEISQGMIAASPAKPTPNDDPEFCAMMHDVASGRKTVNEALGEWQRIQIARQQPS